MSRYDKFRFGIATGGKHRGDVINKMASLEQIRTKMGKPLEDHSVTFAEYMRMTVHEKGERKAMAGFVNFAHFADGKRKKGNQKNRTAAAFDLDNMTLRQLDDIRSGLVPLYAYHFLMHTTRSHCPEKPRVRIILPFSRPVNDAEFYALCRLLACLLADTPDEGIEIPDPVSFKYNQVMYFPSVSRGQEFWFDENPGAILDVDAFLAGFPDWADISTIPQQTKASEARLTEAGAKTEDPTLKKGWIGAFCRAFPVSEAITEFLPDIYAPGDQSTEQRYTYLLGTGANGAIIYDDDKFLHSHHGSDPAEGLHNAWDLARIHKFGDLDDKAHGNTGPTSLPSHKAMLAWVQQIDAVRVAMAADVGFEFDEDEDEEDEGGFDDEGDEADGDADADGDSDGLDFDDDIADLVGDVPKKEKPAKAKKKFDMAWTAELRRKASGELEPAYSNALLICANDPRIAPNIAYNELTHTQVILAPIRANKILAGSPDLREGKNYRPWTDADTVAVKGIFSASAAAKGWGFDPSMDNIRDALSTAATNNSFHPLKDRTGSITRPGWPPEAHAGSSASSPRPTSGAPTTLSTARVRGCCSSGS